MAEQEPRFQRALHQTARGRARLTRAGAARCEQGARAPARLRRVVLTWRFHVLHEFQEFQGGEQGKSASTFLLICCGKTYIWKQITTGTPSKLPARINLQLL